jgi:hypothetical protein
MATIASLIVNIEANTASLVKGVEQVNESIDKMGTMAGKVGGLIAGAFSVAAVKGAVSSFLDFTSTMSDLSTKTGIGTSELQKLKFAAEQNGGSIDMITKGIGKMGKSLIDGDTSAVAAMKALGLSINTVRTMDPATAFATIGDAIAKVPNPLERSKLAMDLFGKSGAELLPTMAGNLSETMQAADKLGIVLDEKTIKAGDDLGDTLAALQSTGAAIIGKMLAPMLPAFQMVANAMLGAGNVVDYLRNMFDALLRGALLAIKGLVDGAIKVGEFAAKVPGLSKVLGDDATAMHAMKDASVFLGGAIEGVTRGADSATASTKKLTAPIISLSDEQKNAAKSAIDHAKAIQSITDKLTGQGAIKAANDMVEALRKAPPIQKLTSDAQLEINKTMAAAIEVYQAQGREAPKAFADLYAATAKLPPLIGIIPGLMKDVGESVKMTIPPFDEFAGMLPKVTVGVDNILKDFLKYDIVPPKVKKTTDSIGELSKSLSQLAQISNGAFGSIVRDLSAVVAALDTAKKSQQAFSQGLASFKAGDTLSGIMQMSSGILGMVTAAISAGKAIAHLVSNLFGLGSAGRDAVKDFAASFGGFDALHEKLLGLGSAGEQLWVNLTQGVGKNDPAAAKAAIDAITVALDNQKTSTDQLLQTQNSDLTDLLGGLQGLGAGDLLQPYLDKLATAKGLTSDNLELVKRLAGDTTVSFDQMQKAAKALGVSEDSLGQSFQNAKAQASWQSIIDNMDTLQRGGANINDLLGDKGLQKTINDLVISSMKFGTEIPANAKPWIQSLIDQGKLLDDNGVKITDTSKLKFGGDLETSIQSLIDKIGELIDKIASGIPAALDKVPSHKTIDVNFNGRKTGDWPSNSDTPDDPAPAATGGLVTATTVIPFARGGWVPRGTDTVPAMLTPGEIVMNAAQQRNVAGGLGGQVVNLAEIRALRADMNRMMRDQPRAIGVAVSDAVTLAVRRR